MSNTVADSITYARQLSQTDSGGITDALGLAFASDAKNNITLEMVKRNLDAAQTKEAFVTLLTTDNPVGQFAWPIDMLALKTVEVDFSNTGNNYVQAQPMDVANIQNISFSNLRVNQSQQYPLFDNRGDTAEVMPTITSSALVRIFYFLLPADYAATGDTIVYPISIDFRCLGARIASLYALSQGQTGMKNRYTISVMTAFENEYQSRLKAMISILAPSSQQPTQPTPLQISGWSY